MAISSPQNRSITPFGSSQPSRFPEIDMTKDIRTFGEQVEDGEIIQGISDIVDSANRLVFLGFSYLDENLELLKRGKRPKYFKDVPGTAYGLSGNDQQVIGSKVCLFNSTRSQPRLYAGKCSDFFNEFSMVVSS